MKNLKILFCLFFLLSIGSTNVWGVSWTCGNTIISTSGSSYVVSPKNNTDGAMADLASAPSTDWGGPSYKNSSSYTSIIFEEGVTHIGANTFNGFSYITSISIPSSLASIGANTFAGCTSISAIHAPNPNVWASVELDISSGRTSHPFFARYNKSNSNKGQFYFYGKETPATEIVFTAGLTEIKKFAFSFSTGITYVHIPGTVTSIGNYALDCNIERIFINKNVAPSTGTNAISWKTGSETYLFLRNNATNSYNTTPWLNANTEETTGATRLCYISDYSGIVTDCGWKSGRKLYKTSGTIGTINWTLAENGTLTLNGTGSMPSTYNTTFNSADVLPWFRFRQLVNKVIIKGGITDIGNALDNCWAIKEISIQQDDIPLGSFGIYINYRPTTEKVEASIPVASLTDASASRLGSTPWNNAKLDIQLSEDVEIDQAEDNATLLANIHTYVEKPFNMNLTRTLSNTMYNTYCSPIDMSAEEVTALFGEDTHLVELDAENTGMNEDDKLVIAFKDATEITAGTPYLIQPANNVVNPSFTNVDPSKVAAEEGVVETEHVDFHGTLNKRTISETEIKNQSVIFLTGTIVDGKQQLTWANGGTLNGMRAYWKVKEGTPASVMAKRPVLQIGNGENTTTDLGQVPSDKIQCTKVLRDGQIYILRGEKAYNLQGIEIDRPNKL